MNEQRWVGRSAVPVALRRAFYRWKLRHRVVTQEHLEYDERHKVRLRVADDDSTLSRHPPSRG